MLCRLAERYGDTTAQLRPIRYGPQREQWSNSRPQADLGRFSIRVRKIAKPRLCIGHKCHVAQPQALPEAFVVSKQKCLVFANGSAQCASKFVPLKRRYR